MARSQPEASAGKVAQGLGWVLDKFPPLKGAPEQQTDERSSIGHMTVSRATETLREVHAMAIDQRARERSTVEVPLEVPTSMRAPQRNAHLRSPDFSTRERIPDTAFPSARVELPYTGPVRLPRNHDPRYHAPIALEGEYRGPLTDIRRRRRLGFELSGRRDREAHGLVWAVPLEAGSVLLGGEVGLRLDSEVLDE